MPRYGLPPEWKGLRFVGGMEYADLGKPEDVQSIELGHGDPLDSQATELRVDTRLLMTDVHEPSREESLRGLALALWDLSEPRPRGLHPDDARRWHESRERDVRQTPLPPFQKVEIPVDGRPVAFDFLSRESRWVAQGRTDDVKITLIARNLDLANVQLVSVADPEPYIRGGRILLERY